MNISNSMTRRRGDILSAIIFSVLMVMSSTAYGVDIRNYYEPGEEVVTPHISWLKPYYQGKIKILFIVPRTELREVVELAQRMDIDYRVFSTLNWAEISAPCDAESSKGDTEGERWAFLREILDRDYDVIVIGGFQWLKLPVDVRYTILKKVKAGCGLAGTVPGQDAVFKSLMKKGTLESSDKEKFVNLFSGFPYQDLKPFSATNSLSPTNSLPEFIEKNAQIATFGKGRICAFGYKTEGSGDFWKYPFHALVPGPVDPPLERNLADYDYQLAFVIRGILWASGKEPPVSIQPQAPLLAFNQKDKSLPELNFSLFNTEKKLKEINAHFFLLDSRGEKTIATNSTAKLSFGENTLAFKAPFLPEGTYRANLIISDNGAKIINFASSIVQVKGECFIKDILLDRKSFRQEDSVTGKILIENPLPDCKLKMSRWDSYGRLLEEKAITQPGGEAGFQFLPRESLTIIQEVKAELTDGDGNPISSKRKYFSIANHYPPKDDMRVVLWAGLRGDPFFTLPFSQYLRKKGIDTQYTGFSESVVWANLWHIPYMVHISDKKTWWGTKTPRKPEDFVRDPCLTDPVYLQNLKETLTTGPKGAESLKDYSVSEFNLGDEDHFVVGSFDLCFSPTCIADFKKFVKEKYQTIEKLNAEYGTEYKSFDEADPLPVEKARKEGRISQWVDHRLHMDSVWAGIFRFGGETIKKIVPEARVGYEGSDQYVNTWLAADYWKLSQAMTLNNLYPGTFVPCAWRSFFAKDKLLGLGWFGGYRSPYERKHWYESQYQPWLSLFKGANSLWIWHAAPKEGSVTAPDFAFYDYFEDALMRMKEMKSGLGKALIRADRFTDIGIFYSPSSIHTETFFGSQVDPDKHLKSITQLFIDIGFQPRIYSYEEVKQGLLSKEKPAILFLHNSQSLSPEEVNGFKNFVSEGGVLIADIRPGVRNAQGKALVAGQLDELFGIKFSHEGKEGKLEKKDSLIMDNERFVFPIPVWHDPHIILTDGKGHAQIAGLPAVVYNSFGKGKTILLNFTLENYLMHRQEWLKDPASALLKKILANEDIYPPVRLAPEIPYLEVTRFQSGNIRYITFLQDLPGESSRNKSLALEIPDKKPSLAAKVSLPYKGHLYNVREGKYLGEAQDVAITIQPLEPVIIASLPYRIADLSLSLSAANPQQGETVKYKIELKTEKDAPPEEQIIRIEIFDPTGAKAEHYSKNLAVKGISEEKHEIALNDTPGRWTIVATDLVSKKDARTCFTVKEK